MATTTREPRPQHAPAGGGDSTIAQPTLSTDRTGHATTMQAIVQDQYGAPDVLTLQEIDTPAIGDDDVLIRVQAASVHIGDWHVMTGLPYLMRIMGFGVRAPKARVRGMDVAGTVEAVGTNVTRFQAGDEVFGTCDGAFAEYAVARAATLAPKPATLTFAQAAAVPTSACTALQALRDAGGITSRANGADRGCVGRRGAVRGADCQSVGHARDRRVQHGQAGPGPRRWALTRSSTTPKGTSRAAVSAMT